VVLPILLSLVFGIIEFGRLFMIRQTLLNAAREGCRVAVLQAATEEDVMTRIEEIMEPYGLGELAIWTAERTDIQDDTQWVRISIPVEDVALTGTFVLPDLFSLAGECSMRKEGSILPE
jgi:hypothetical protein